MNKINSRALLAAIAGLAIAQFASPAASAADFTGKACDIAPLATPTLFPNSSQQPGDHGVVKARLHVDSNGVVQDAAILDSSGHPRLDRAAIESIRKYWRFSVAHCSAADLAREQTVTVRFERTQEQTVSNTVSGTAIARINELRADSRCAATRVDADTTVFSCINGGVRQSAIADASKTAGAQ